MKTLNANACRWMRWLSSIWLCIAPLLFAACGTDGPARYDVSGAVTFDGQPVPAGRIVFEPDSTQSNQGPAAYADIESGRYATPRGKGHVGGPHVVRITGTDGVPSGELPDGRQLFPEYKTTLDLPQDDADHDFDVPATASN